MAKHYIFIKNEVNFIIKMHFNCLFTWQLSSVRADVLAGSSLTVKLDKSIKVKMELAPPGGWLQ